MSPLSPLILVLALPPASGADRIAMMPFEMVGFDEDTPGELGSVYADIAAAELQRLGQAVVSVADVRARVQLDQLKEVLRGCEGETCGGDTARLGEMLDVETLMRGSVLRNSKGFMVSLTLLSASSGKATGRFDGAAGSDVMVSATIRRGIRVLLGREYDPGAVGILSVRTVPRGARVEVDGQMMGQSPLTLQRFPVGDHEVVLTSSTARVVRPILVEPSQIARVDIDLDRPPVTVHLFSQPEGAKVTRDGVLLGTAPLLLRDVPAQPVELEFSASGYRSAKVSVDLRAMDRQHPGRPISVQGSLQPQWPVGLGLVLGVVSDAGAVTDGVGFTGELAVDLGDHVQLGFGGTVPASGFGAIRAYLLRDGLELGALGRVAGIVSAASGIPEDARTARVVLQVGLVIGWTTETAAGRFGLLVEGGPAIDLGNPGDLSIPVTVAAQWRFR